MGSTSFNLLRVLEQGFFGCGPVGTAINQVVVIGRALMARPKLILLDEPSMGLAPQLVAEIFDIVRRLHEEEGVSFLLAEQNTAAALRVADYGYILENGRVVLDGSAETLRHNRGRQRVLPGPWGGRATELS